MVYYTLEESDNNWNVFRNQTISNAKFDFPSPTTRRFDYVKFVYKDCIFDFKEFITKSTKYWNCCFHKCKIINFKDNLFVEFNMCDFIDCQFINSEINSKRTVIGCRILDK